jgi:hypothetical protein
MLTVSSNWDTVEGLVLKEQEYRSRVYETPKGGEIRVYGSEVSGFHMRAGKQEVEGSFPIMLEAVQYISANLEMLVALSNNASPKGRVGPKSLR